MSTYNRRPLSPKAAQVKETALRLHSLGANICVVQEGEKKPYNAWLEYTTERQELDWVHALQWEFPKYSGKGLRNKQHERVGILNGFNGWRTIDVDAIAEKDEDGNIVKRRVPREILDEILDGLGLPVDYAWCGRSGSGAGFHIIFRCTDTLTRDFDEQLKAAVPIEESKEKEREVGVVLWAPKEEHTEDFKVIELRWERNFTTFAKLHGYSDGMLDAEVGLVNAQQVIDALSRVAAPKTPTKSPAKTPAKTPTSSTMSATTAPTQSADTEVSVIDAFNQRYHVEDILENNGYVYVRNGAESGWVHPDTSDRTKPGVRYVKGDDSKVQSFSATDPLNDGHNKDAFACYTLLEHAGNIGAAVKEAARLLGISTKPKRAARATEPVAPLPQGQDGARAELPSLPVEYVVDCLNRNQFGDADMFSVLFADTARYDEGAKDWYLYVGPHWKRCTVSPYTLVGRDVAAQYLAVAAVLTKDGGRDKEVKELLKRAQELRTRRRSEDVLSIAKSIEALTIQSERWDSSVRVLAVLNGVVELATGNLREARPDDYILNVAPVTWEGLHAAAPKWERFIADVMSDEADRVEFLHRMIGYAIQGTTREHTFVICVGEGGRNGKGVLFETLRTVLGPYSASVSKDVLVGSDSKRAGAAAPHIMSLQGRRLVYCSETDEFDSFDAAQVKHITSSDEITARNLYERQRSFTPTHTVFLQTNFKPSAPADDDALWERVKVLEFKARFVEEPTRPHERLRDTQLKERLAEEAPGILAWAVRGGLRYLQDGLSTPTSVKLARERYRQEESLDAFVEQACERHSMARVSSQELYDAYVAFNRAQNLHVQSTTKFGRMMKALGLEKTRDVSGRTQYIGITVRPGSFLTTTRAADADTSIDEWKMESTMAQSPKKSGTTPTLMATMVKTAESDAAPVTAPMTAAAARRISDDGMKRIARLKESIRNGKYPEYELKEFVESWDDSWGSITEAIAELGF